MAAPPISIVIPCYRHALSLRRCLTGLAALRDEPPHEVIVVASGADPELASVTREFPQIGWVLNEERLSSAAARNAGARAAHGEVLFFLDADCIPEAGWIAAGERALAGGARLVGGPVLDALPWHPIAVSDNLLQFADFGAGRPDGPARYFPGCNMALRREDLETLGGFSEPRAPTGEDTLLSLAAAALWPDGLRFANAMRVRHEGRTQMRAFLEHQRSFGYTRATLGIWLTPLQRKLGRSAIALPAVAVRRLVYIARSAARYQPAGLVRFVACLPLLVLGLGAWALGFRQGLREKSHS